MKTLKEKSITALITANSYYSVFWMFVTGADKWAYREKSLVHSVLVSAAYALLRKA